MRALLFALLLLSPASPAAAATDPRALVQSVAETHVRGELEAALNLLQQAKGDRDTEEEQGVRNAFATSQPTGFTIAADLIAYDTARAIYVVYQGPWLRIVQYGFHRRGADWKLDGFRYAGSYAGLRDFGSVAAASPLPTPVERSMALHRDGKHEDAIAGWRLDKSGRPTQRLDDVPPNWAQGEAGALVAMAKLGAIDLIEVLADEQLGELRETEVLYRGEHGQMVASYTTRLRDGSWVPHAFWYQQRFMTSQPATFARTTKFPRDAVRGLEPLFERTVELHANQRTRDAFNALQDASAFKLPLEAIAAIRLAADREPPGRVLARLPDQQLGEHLRLRRIVYDFGSAEVVANFVMSRRDTGDWRLDSWAYDRRLLSGIQLTRNGGNPTKDALPPVITRIIEAHRAGKHTDAVDLLHTGPKTPPLVTSNNSATTPSTTLNTTVQVDAKVEVMMARLGTGIEATVLSNLKYESLRELIVAYRSPSGIVYARYLLGDRSGVWFMMLSNYFSGSTLLLANHAAYEAIKPARS